VRRHGPALWACLLLTGTIIECYALRRRMHEHTLSHATRYMFRTSTRPGRAVFMFTWSAFTSWFLIHILAPDEKLSS
jgi:hypothetical protein